MALPREFVELLETHAEITIRDDVARKRFTLVLRSLGTVSEEDALWIPLTLEPGQVPVRFSGDLRWNGLSRDASLGLRGVPRGGTFSVELETLETIRPERGWYRIETLNAFLHEASVSLRRRTVVARIESSNRVGRVYSPTHPVSVVHEDRASATLALDVGGDRSQGRFRFFYALGEVDSPRHPDEPEEASEPHQILATDGVGVPSGRMNSADLARELLKPCRSRPRRRASWWRSPLTKRTSQP
jgi:hypothetical protein